MLHDRIKRLRIAKEMTQEELAKVLDVSPSTVGMYEQGRRKPDNDTLIKIANIFEVTTDYLLGKESYPESKKYIDELLQIMEKKGYDISGMTTEEIAQKLIKGFKLDELYKSD